MTSTRLASVILVVAALSVGRVVTQFAPEADGVRPFERAGSVGEPLTLRYAELTVTDVEGGRRTDDGSALRESPGIWLVVRLTVTPTLDRMTFAYAELRTGKGAVLSPSARAQDSCPATNPGVATACVIAFEIAPSDAVGAQVALTRNANDQRADDMAVIDLGVTAAEVASWRDRTDPVKTSMQDPR